MRIVYILVFSFSLTTLLGQLEVSPDPPVLGQPLKVTAGLDFTRRTLHKGDRVFVVLSTDHEGLKKSLISEMRWNGQQFSTDLSVPQGCSRVIVIVSTPEKFVAQRNFTPVNINGEVPVEALVHTKDWKTALEHNPRMWWAYRGIWAGLDAFGQIDRQELDRQLEFLESEESTPELLRFLAYGYWVAGDGEKALATLTRLCRAFPESSYAVAAVNDAPYVARKKNLGEEVREQAASLITDIVNLAPGNPYIRQELNAVSYLNTYSHLITEKAARELFRQWVSPQPDSPYPYYLLAKVLSRDTASLTEAEQAATEAIKRFFKFGSYGVIGPYERPYFRGFAYRLRSEIRRQLGNLPDALADIKMAQEYTLKHWTDDLDGEAELWREMDYLEKAEEVALEAYRKASLKAEQFLKELYVQRTGTEQGFSHYFMTRLTDNTGMASKDSLSAQAPHFQVNTLDGRTVDSDSLKGKIVVLNFWFTACGPCVGEIPELNKIVDTHKRDEIVFLAFATDPPEHIREFLKEHEFNYEIVPNAGEIARLYKVESYPSHYLIDQEGRIAWKARGAHPDNIKRLQEMIRRLR